MAPRASSCTLGLVGILLALAISASFALAADDQGIRWIPGHNGQIVGDPPGDGGGGDGGGDPDELAILWVPPGEIEFESITTVGPPADPKGEPVRSWGSAYRLRMLFAILATR